MDKGLYLKEIAKHILPVFVYNELRSKFVIGYNEHGFPIYDNDKMYEVLSNVEELKEFDKRYDEFYKLVKHGRIRELMRIVKNNLK